MRNPNPEELQTADTLQDDQAGAPLNTFNRGAQLRHAQLGTWWERILAVMSLIFVTMTVISLAIRAL